MTTTTCTVTKINNNTGECINIICSGTWSDIHSSRYECSYPIPENVQFYFKLDNDITHELGDMYHLDIDEEYLDYDDNGVLGWFSTTYGKFVTND